MWGSRMKKFDLYVSSVLAGMLIGIAGTLYIASGKAFLVRYCLPLHCSASAHEEWVCLPDVSDIYGSSPINRPI